jgi:diaminohydroxyphosphoribosylaminopyrimidine deaminase/5-amino-6-(5-phosphoribosylamino)uracil reductase
MNYVDLDQVYMGMAIEEAKLGLGHANPNPLVGAILVKDGNIIGSGHHQRYGGHHAEVNAILNAKENLHDVSGSTLYVNLEPCSHLNKQTPPCAPKIIQEGIKKVVIANIDPNPSVSGNGIKLLEESNVEVVVGVLKEEGEILNEVFFKAMKERRPFVHLKMAQTLDGKIATLSGESKYISSDVALGFVHQLRQNYDVIVVGKNTILKDNPSLTVRYCDGVPKHPLRVLFIDLKSINFELKIFSDEFKKNSMVVTTDSDLQNNREIAMKLEANGIGLLSMPEDEFGRVDLDSFLKTMFSLKFYSILIEGGPTLASSFIKKKLVDKLSLVTSPYILGEGLATLNDIGINSLDNKIELKKIELKNLGKDFLFEGYLCLQD